MEGARYALIGVACSSVGSARDMQGIADSATGSKEVGLFLDDGNCKSLRARVSSSGDIEFMTQLSEAATKGDENSVDVLFVRRVPEPINAGNLYSAMEVQTVRTIQPQHFDQYWQAGILSWKSDFEMNMHGPYYAELLGSKRERNRTLSKMETSLQAGKIINARHLTFHVGPYGEYEPGTEANEQVANVMAGGGEGGREGWGDEGEGGG